MNEKPSVETPAVTQSLPKIMATPIAYLQVGRNKNIVVKLEGTSDYTLLVGPEYLLAGAMRGDWVLAATVAKYGFTEYEDPQEPMILEDSSEKNKESKNT